MPAQFLEEQRSVPLRVGLFYKNRSRLDYFSSLMSTVRRTLHDLYNTYFSPEVMVSYEVS